MCANIFLPAFRVTDTEYNWSVGNPEVENRPTRRPYFFSLSFLMFHYTEDDEVHGSSSDEEPLFEHNLTDDDEFCENVMDGDIARPAKTFQGWHHLENSAIKLNVSTSSVDDIIFTAAKKEFEAVQVMLLLKLSLSDGQKPTLLDVFLAHVDPFFAKTERTTGLTRRELLVYTIIRCGEMRYGVPASDMFRNPEDFNSDFRPVSWNVHQDIARKIRIAPEQASDPASKSWNADSCPADSLNEMRDVDRSG